jgi:hypothetical protein
MNRIAAEISRENTDFFYQNQKELVRKIDTTRAEIRKALGLLSSITHQSNGSSATPSPD